MKIKRVLGVCALTAALSAASGAQTLVDRIVAVVDKEIITESELQERVNFIALQNRLDPSKPELRRQVLDSYIGEKLILAQAILDSVEVTDDQVSQALDQQIQNLTRQAGSTENLERYYGKSIARIKREFKEEMRKQLLVQRVRQMREADISVSRREVEEFFETYKDSLPQVPETYELSHIFVVPKPDSIVEAATRGKLQAILDSIRAGGSFEDFARRYSQDASSSSGGDLGWAKRGDFVRDFEEAAFRLKEGEVSGVVKTQYGFHLIQLVARRGESIHVRHILLKIGSSAVSDSAAVRKLDDIRSQVQKGAPFADMAKKYSEDEDTKALGGDLGDLTADQLTPEFAQAVRDLKEGEISAPHRVTLGVSYGFQIIWMRKRAPAHAMNLNDDYNRVEQLALYFKRNKMYEQWINELKKNIYWEVRM